MDDAEHVAQLVRQGLPKHLGLNWEEARPGYVRGFVQLGEEHFAGNGYVHAGTLVTLADSACGYGCRLSLPEGAVNFTTVELKGNFLGTAKEGRLVCEAKLVHSGRATQVWDAEVKRDDGRTVTLFRATELMIYAQ